MSEGKHAIFDQIVLEGALASNGMASFADLLNKTDTDRIHAYIIHQATTDRNIALAAEAEGK